MSEAEPIACPRCDSPTEFTDPQVMCLECGYCGTAPCRKYVAPPSFRPKPDCDIPEDESDNWHP